MAKAVDASTLRSHLADVLDEVARHRDYVLVTKRDKPVSALVNLDLFEDLLALTSLDYRKSIREARRQVRTGKVYTHDEILRKLG